MTIIVLTLPKTSFRKRLHTIINHTTLLFCFLNFYSIYAKDHNSELDIEILNSYSLQNACTKNENPLDEAIENNSSNQTSKITTPKEYAQKSFEQALQYAKQLRVFEANKAFEISLCLDPQNKDFRESYAWHLQAFSLLPEALYQFYILLPNESKKTMYYQTIGWDNHTLGRYCSSIKAFSTIYNFPLQMTFNDQFLLINNCFTCQYLAKINDLKRSLIGANQTEFNEIKIKIFDSYTYIGDLNEATKLALQILKENPKEYMVRYRLAHLLHEKKKYIEALSQFNQLLKQLPLNAFLHLNVGQILEDMECNSAALKAYQTAYRLNQNPRTKRAYARILSKLGCCPLATNLSRIHLSHKHDNLTPNLSKAEVLLNCKDYKSAACIYRNILFYYPYNQEALWGLLKSSSYTHNSNDARVSYKRWSSAWFNYPLQNYLANFYKQPQLSLPAEYYQDSTTFKRFSIGLDYSQYLFDNIRGYTKTYYTQFDADHFDRIDRGTILVGFNKMFNKNFDLDVELIENFYNNLQLNANPINQDLKSKAVFNYHLHLIYHRLPIFTVDLGYDYYDVIDTIPPFNNPVYNYSNQIGATSLNIRTADWNLLLYYSKEKIYWSANFIYGNYSDGNTKTSNSIRTGYRFLDLPSTSIYYNYFYLNFKNPAPLFTQNNYSVNAYYDPKNFELHTIGIDTKYDITKMLQIGGEIGLVYIPKCTNFGYSAFGYFNYILSDRWSLRIDLRYYYQTQGISRTGITGYFHAENASAKLNYEF